MPLPLPLFLFAMLIFIDIFSPLLYCFSWLSMPCHAADADAAFRIFRFRLLSFYAIISTLLMITLYAFFAIRFSRLIFRYACRRLLFHYIIICFDATLSAFATFIFIIFIYFCLLLLPPLPCRRFSLR